MDLPVAHLIRTLGDDGSEKIFPLAEEPLCRKGFHIQNLVDYCLTSGHALVEIQAMPTIYDHNLNRKSWPIHSDRFQNQLHKYSGIILGSGNKVPHAWAWSHYDAIAADPSIGKYCDLKSIKSVRCLYALLKIR